jgi:hypothetical protein
MTEQSRRSFLKTAAVGGALTGGAVLLPGGLARAAATAQGPLPQTRAATYRLHVTNNSNGFETFAVYQADPDLGVGNVMSLAWFAKGAHPTQSLSFEWTIDYSVVWSETDMTGNPGDTVTFEVGQEVPVNPGDIDNNGVELGYSDGVPYLQLAPLTVGNPQLGNIYVNEISTLPDQGVGTIGLAIGGSPAYAAPAAPNRLEVFTPHPNYWITAGTFEAGVALDVEEISSYSQNLPYPSGVTELWIEFGRDRTWSVSESPQ